MGQSFANQRPGVNIVIGTVTADQGSIAFSNAGGFTWGMGSTATNNPYAITISGGGPALSAGTSSVDGGATIVFSNSNGISFGLSGSTVTAKTGDPVSFFDAPGGRNNTFSANNDTNPGGAFCHIRRFSLARPINVTEIDIYRFLSASGSSAGSTGMTHGMTFGVYTFRGSTASLASFTSFSHTFVSGSTTNATSVYGGYSGTRIISIPIAASTFAFTPGEYLFAFMHSFQPTTSMSISFFGRSSISIVGAIGGGNYSQYFGDGFVLVTQDSNGSIVFRQSFHQSLLTQTGATALAQPFFRLIGS